MSERVTSNPIPWIRLIEISGMPKVRNPRFTIGMFASYAEHPENPADESSIQNAAEEISDLINTSKFLARRRMLDDPNVGLAAAISIESPHRHADMSSVYIHQGTVYLKSIARESYDEIREVLEPIVQLPEDPMLDVSFGLYTFADDWYAATDTLHLLIEAFDDEIFDGDEEDLDDDGGFPDGNKPSATMPDFNITTDLDTINAVSAELITARNAGEEPDINRIMKNTGASRSNVEAIQKMIEYSLSNMGVDTDIPGPFDLPPAAVHALTSPPLEEAEGLLSLDNLAQLKPAAFQNVPIIRLYKALTEAEDPGGFIPVTAAGYIKPAIVKKLAQILPDQLGFLEPEEVKKESDWFWLERMRNLLTSADILLVESKGFRLAFTGTDPATIKDIYLRTLSALFRHHPWGTHPRFNFEDESWIHGTSALLLYGLKYLADNAADHRVYDYEMAPHLARYVPEYRETLRDDPDQDPRKFDTPVGYLGYRVISLFFQQFCIPLGLAESIEVEPLKPKPVVPTPLLDALVRLRT
ncbi:hypothetical protein [Salinispira pacifica]|uniref:Uncharacterized protein n=1 Tax=Salinispira pacifica TaxID=1307761 RepID=V5WLN5_9SPIO|nr:hypothetical protein [Salinispira pacifica]AHC16513.1 hypothetical protein L21SP2_3173 [Salinispira pacifica]